MNKQRTHNKINSQAKRGKRNRQANKKGNFVLTAHLVSAFSVPAGGVRQINIAPTPNLFNRIFTQAPNFQSFTVKRV